MTYTFFYQGPFSQWSRHSFVVDDVAYGCAEQYMMHQKALLFGDREAAKGILAASHPRDQKAIGRKVRGFDEGRWNAVARDIVYRGNYHKFRRNDRIRQLLFDTVGTTLVEASPTDCIWGIGLGQHDDRRHDPKQWRGTNWLGEVLTLLRDDLLAGLHRKENFGWKP